MEGNFTNPKLRGILNIKNPIELRKQYRNYVQQVIKIDDILYDDFMFRIKSNIDQTNIPPQTKRSSPPQTLEGVVAEGCTQTEEERLGIEHLIKNVESKLKHHTPVKVIKLLSFLMKHDVNKIHKGTELKKIAGLKTLSHYTLWKRDLGQYMLLLRGDKRGTYLSNPVVINALKKNKRELIEF